MQPTECVLQVAMKILKTKKSQETRCELRRSKLH